MSDSAIKQPAFPSTSRRTRRSIAFAFALLGVAGCEQRAAMVYVLDSPQSVTLNASAAPSAVRQGETVVLHVTRRTAGKWKQIPRDQLRAGQCWVYRPPGEAEQEVARDLQWDVVPRNAVRFEREYRMDGARTATVMAKGTIKLTPFSPVTCEGDRVVEGPPVFIEVS